MIADQHFSEEFDAHLKAYLEANWDAMMADLARLVEIPSVEDLPAAAPGAPFGPEPARALEAALALAERLGLDAHNMDGYVGYADALCGREGAKQLGIIGHVDVVGAGPGWTVEPFAVTEREGYLTLILIVMEPCNRVCQREYPAEYGFEITDRRSSNDQKSICYQADKLSSDLGE